jgi:SNF2 family DNA or RNA helicase
MDAIVRSNYVPDQTALQRNYGLNVTLKPYQQQTVEWMIAEEKHPHGFHRHFFSPDEFANPEGLSSRVWYSPTFSILYSDSELPDRHGGVVCEEMGLGKTIEAIALIAANRVRRPQLNQLISNGGRVRHQSAATLVLVPPSLVGQWCEEFERRHVGNLRVLKFYGNKKPTTAAELLCYDVVLTTFQILTMDLGVSNSLLDLIHWHRLIVDEGHILRNGSTWQVRAINRLQARNRWCLTGTPFSTSVKDEIPGYLEFLGLVPTFLNQDRDNETCAEVMRNLFMRYFHCIVKALIR